ncbi:hypothetical protein J3A83DRAFT_33602 [Scleroderma citrinum]
MNALARVQREPSRLLLDVTPCQFLLIHLVISLPRHLTVYFVSLPYIHLLLMLSFVTCIVIFLTYIRRLQSLFTGWSYPRRSIRSLCMFVARLLDLGSIIGQTRCNSPEVGKGPNALVSYIKGRFEISCVWLVSRQPEMIHDTSRCLVPQVCTPLLTLAMMDVNDQDLYSI